MKGSRKKGFQIRLSVDERDWLTSCAAMRALTPSALVRSLIKKEYQALQRAERERVGLEADDILVLKALGESESPRSRFELQFQFRWQLSYKERSKWVALRVRRLKTRGYVQRVGECYSLTARGHAAIPV